MKSPKSFKVGRRLVLAGIAASLVALVPVAFAAQPSVEIIAFAHPPVEDALKPVRAWLKKQGTKVRVVELDMEGPEAQSRLKAIGLTGHLPIVILIDGQYRYTRPDGINVQFVGFPAAAGSPAAAKGTWSTGDVEAALKTRI